MSSYDQRFRLNKVDGKVLGVCAGLADHFDVDITLVRIAMVLSMIVTFPIVSFGYLIVALVASSGGGMDKRRNEDRFDPERAPRLTDPEMDHTRQRVRDLDTRLAAIEDHMAGNRQLAREIDALR